METQFTFRGVSNFRLAPHPTTQRMLRDRQKERLLARTGAMEATATTLKRQAQTKLNLSHGADIGNSAYHGRTEIRMRRSETD
jgi:predicted membrane metal-binding protein